MVKKLAWMIVIGAAVATLAFAIDPRLSNAAPEGFVPTPGESPGGDGCPCLSGTPEGEANCGLPVDTVNGGCNSAPEVFSPISLGETVCGTAEWNVTVPGFRDTDWYEYTVTTAGTYHWQVMAEFPAAIFIIDASAGCAAPSVIGAYFTTGCGDLGVVSLDLVPGTYWFFVAPDFGGPPLTCGAQYTATLWGELPAQAIPTVGKIGLVAIGILLAGLAFYVLRRRRTATA